MNGYEIRYLMSKRKVTVTAIAKELGISVAAVSQTIHGLNAAPKTIAALSRALDIPAADLFPAKEEEAADHA